MRKECPSCAERVRPKARKCRYCGEALSPEPDPEIGKLLWALLIVTVVVLIAMLGRDTDERASPQRPTGRQLPKRAIPSSPAVQSKPLPASGVFEKEAIKYALQPCLNHFAGKAPGFEWTRKEWDAFMEKEPSIKVSLAGLMVAAEQVASSDKRMALYLAFRDECIAGGL